MSGMKRKLLSGTLIWGLLIASTAARGETARPEGKGLKAGSQEYNDPLKIKGQTRRLNMLLNLKSDAEIKFVRLRKNYRNEILATQY